MQPPFRRCSSRSGRAANEECPPGTHTPSELERPMRTGPANRDLRGIAEPGGEVEAGTRAAAMVVRSGRLLS